MTTTPIAAPFLDRARHLRGLLTTDGPLAGAAIGTMPLLWTSAGTDERGPWQDPEAILDEIARIGYEGSQLGTGFPEGEPLRALLAARELRLAEVYASIAVTVDGPTDEALADVRERLRLLVAGRGEVLCIAVDGSPDRNEVAGHADDADTPHMTDAGWDAFVALLRVVSAETRSAGARIAFHPHAGTYVETPAEVERLAAAIDARRTAAVPRRRARHRGRR
jgi:inosose dehydratase